MNPFWTKKFYFVEVCDLNEICDPLKINLTFVDWNLLWIKNSFNKVKLKFTFAIICFYNSLSYIPLEECLINYIQWYSYAAALTTKCTHCTLCLSIITQILPAGSYFKCHHASGKYMVAQKELCGVIRGAGERHPPSDCSNSIHLLPLLHEWLEDEQICYKNSNLSACKFISQATAIEFEFPLWTELDRIQKIWISIEFDINFGPYSTQFLV